MLDTVAAEATEIHLKRPIYQSIPFDHFLLNKTQRTEFYCGVETTKQTRHTEGKTEHT